MAIVSEEFGRNVGEIDISVGIKNGDYWFCYVHESFELLAGSELIINERQFAEIVPCIDSHLRSSWVI